MSRISAELDNRIYKVPEVTAIYNNRRNVDDVKINNSFYIGDVQVGEKKVRLESTVSEKDCEFLHANGERSKVGKNDQTVLDEYVRKSKEYMSDKIDWDQDFIKYIRKEIEYSLRKMNAGNLVSATPHKLIIYGEGDFFCEHIDSVHTKGQTMTAILELESWHRGGSFIVGKEKAKVKKGVRLIVFDHDIPHQVKNIHEGYRVSISFDIVVRENEIEKIDIEKRVNELRTLGIRKIGFFCAHTYLGIHQDLKGCDYRVVEAFRPYFTSEIKLLNLSMFDNRYSFNEWYHPKVWEVMNSGPESGTVLEELDGDEESEEEDESEEESEEEDESEDEIVYEEEEKEMIDEAASWSPRKSDNNIFLDEYSLGDIFVIQTPYNPKLVAKGSEEILLGNECFEGEVYSEMFVVMNI